MEMKSVMWPGVKWKDNLSPLNYCNPELIVKQTHLSSLRSELKCVQRQGDPAATARHKFAEWYNDPREHILANHASYASGLSYWPSGAPGRNGLRKII